MSSYEPFENLTAFPLNPNRFETTLGLKQHFVLDQSIPDEALKLIKHNGLVSHTSKADQSGKTRVRNASCPTSRKLVKLQTFNSTMSAYDLIVYYTCLDVTRSSTVIGQICTPHLLIILTKPACHHNSFWGSRCDSNQAHTISLIYALFQGDFG